MKVIICFFVFLLTTNSILGQLQYNRLMETYPLNNAVNCKNHEKIVIEASDYLLSNPINSPDNNRYYAYNYIETWIIQTPDYYFDIPPEINEIIGFNIGLKAIYKASLCKYTLTHDNVDVKSKSFRVHVLSGMLSYIEEPKNKVTITKPITKYLKAKKLGVLGSVVK